MTRMWSVLQAAAEYVAATGQAVSGSSSGPSVAAQLNNWAANNRMALVAAVAVLALVVMIRGATRRR